ncbi:MAG: choice-of-anchor tandem repeat GloVer-containing protein [Terriglobales bacterium]
MRKVQTFALALLVLTVASVASLHAQTFSVLYNFGSAGGDPIQPLAAGTVAQGQDGSLYSTTPNGGANNQGAVFRISPDGTLSVVYSFVCCWVPLGGLTLGTDGKFYGASQGGGALGDGTVYTVTPAGVLTVLHDFTGLADGDNPKSQPIEGTDRNFYGTTWRGANNACGNGCGTVYRITPAGDFTTLYSFDFTHGFQPWGPLVLGTNGNFYGTTSKGGTSGGSGGGVVFKITPAGKLTVLHNFCSQPGCTDGQDPTSPLVQGTDGSFYGTTGQGGANGFGEVFKITAGGTLTVLHSFNGTSDGYIPFEGNAGLVQATDGNFYGANTYGGSLGFGTFFQITPKGAFSVLYNFDGTTGWNPYVTPFQHTNGVIYGDTQLGGTGNVSPCIAGSPNASCGVFYSWTAPGLRPFVRLLPYSGNVGDTIEFLGQGFTATTTVSFNGTTANRTIVSGTYLTATVPSGARTGLVTVTTSGGKLKSNKKFRVTPQITSFSPASGPVGTVVTITGVSLTQTTKVTFGGVVATSFTVNSDTQVTATVPSGAKTGKIVITTPGGMATSTTNFTVTP